MEWFLLQRFVDLVRIYFLLIVGRNHSNKVKYCSDIRILTDLRRLKINRWRNFKDKGQLFTLNLQMTTTKTCRIFLHRTFFVSLDKSVLFHRRYLMSKFPEILILLCRKTFSVYYPIFHVTFSNSCGFALI